MKSTTLQEGQMYLDCPNCGSPQYMTEQFKKKYCVSFVCETYIKLYISPGKWLENVSQSPSCREIQIDDKGKARRV